MISGVYCLQLRLDTETVFSVGALGPVTFPAGYYVYVGSALGSGGLSRVSRHIRFYREQYRKPKWHIDYLMMHAVLEKTYCTQTSNRLECPLARALGGDGIPRFGCSDCDCSTHLFYRRQSPEEDIRAAFAKLKMPVTEHTVL